MKPVVVTPSKTPALVAAILVADLYSARWLAKGQYDLQNCYLFRSTLRSHLLGKRPIMCRELDYNCSKREFLTLVIKQAARIRRIQSRQYGKQVSSRFSGWPHV